MCVCVCAHCVCMHMCDKMSISLHILKCSVILQNGEGGYKQGRGGYKQSIIIIIIKHYAGRYRISSFP